MPTEKKCVFCEIINGNRDASLVYEGEHTLAFLDYRPLYFGHVVLVPREHYPTLMDLPERLIQPLFSDLKLLSQAVEIAMGTDGIFNAINNRMSQSVPHIHIHIVPRRHKDNMRHFMWPRKKYESEEHIVQTQSAIQEAIRELRQDESNWDFLRELTERLLNIEQDLEKTDYQKALDRFIRDRRRETDGIAGLSLYSSKEKVKEILKNDKVLATLFLKEYILNQ